MYCLEPMVLYIVVTVPFHNAMQRAIHFQRHGNSFGASNEFDYERMAEAFMAAPMHANLHECYRTTGTLDRIRLDALTLHFGVAFNVVMIRTYFIRSASEIAKSGGPAAFVASKCAQAS
jgi:hypothetical protein